MGARTSGDYPRTLAESHRRFPDDAACLRYLVETRWPEGFRCPACGSREVGSLSARRLWQCRACRHQASVTSGTILHRTRLPLTVWFSAAYLVASLKPGISALQPSQQLGLHYETAWLLLHKLRRAMVNPERRRLRGEVEVDETWVGGKQAGLKGGRQRHDREALLVAAAVERGDRALGRSRPEVVPDASQGTSRAFVERNVEPGAAIISDAWSGYGGLAGTDYLHLSSSQTALRRAGLGQDAVPGVHRVISNLKTWLRGTHHGVGADHLAHYLQEYVSRSDRRSYPMAGFASLLGLGTVLPPTTTQEILSPLLAPEASRRPGRSTGLTSRRVAVEIDQQPSLDAARASLERKLANRGA